MPAKKKKLVTVIAVDIPIYNQVIVAAKDSNELVKYVEETYKNAEITQHMAEFAEVNQGGFIHFETDNGHQALLLFAPELSTLCHEVIHAAWSVLDMVGIKVKHRNHEALAYLAGHIFESCQEGLEY